MKFLSAMYKMRFIALLFVSLLASTLLQAQSDKDLPARPVPPTLVNDLAEVLNAEQESQLESKLIQYNDSTSSQIAVVTVKSTGNFEISDYAYKLGRKWGVGQEDKDNGIVILVAVDDRAVYIATGYGVEGYLTDIATGRIINDVMLPQFRTGDYYGGIDAASDEIFKYMTGAYEGMPMGSGNESPNAWFIIIIIIIILILMSRNKGKGGTTFSGRGPTYWGGGGFGGFGGGGGGGGFGGFGGGSFGGGGAGGRW